MARTACAGAASVVVHIVAGAVLLGLPATARRPVVVALPMEVRAETRVAESRELAPAAAAAAEPARKAGKAGKGGKAAGGRKAVARTGAAAEAVAVAESVAVTESVVVTESVGASPAATASASAKAGSDGDGNGYGNGNGNGYGNGVGGEGIVFDPPHPAEATENYTRLVPPYSDAAIDSDVNGAVSLRLEIDASGRVAKASVLHGLGHGLDEIAVATALKYRFHPARDAAGKPVRTVIGWNIVWESYWKRLVVETIAGHPNCRGHGPMNLGETHPEYIDCDHPAGEFELDPGRP